MGTCKYRTLAVLIFVLGTSIFVSLMAQYQPRPRPVDIYESLALENPIIYSPYSCANFIKDLTSRFTESKISYSLSNTLETKSISDNNIIAIGCYFDSVIKECLALTPLSLNKHTLIVDTSSYSGDDIRLIFHVPNPYNPNKNILVYTTQDEKNIPDIIAYAEEIKNWDFVAYRKKEGDRYEGNMIIAGKFKEINGKILVDSIKVWRKDPDKFHIIKKNQISYLFPENSYAYSNRYKLIDQCESAIKKNLAIIREEKYSGSMQVQFVSSREEMKSYLGFPASGYADPFLKIVYIFCDSGYQGPDVHELMHMVACNAWGWPPHSSYWMNEGVATCAANSCSNYTVDQLYAFFSEKKMLIPMDSLASDFYKNPEMIAYHQSGYMVQYLIEKYGIQKLKNLWQSGFQDFEKIYGKSYQKTESDIRQELKIKFPVVPEIDWDILKQGCK